MFSACSVRRFLSSTCLWLHRACSLCGLKSLTQTSPLPNTCISNDTPWYAVSTPFTMPCWCHWFRWDLIRQEEVGTFGTSCVKTTPQQFTRPLLFCIRRNLLYCRVSHFQRSYRQHNAGNRFVMEILDMPLQIVRFSCSFQTDNLCLHSFECLGSWANISLFSNAHAVLTKK